MATTILAQFALVRITGYSLPLRTTDGQLSVVRLVRFLFNDLFRLWWADPVAALIIVPIIVKEGIEGLQGKACDDTVGGSSTVTKERSADSLTSSPHNNRT